jgi:PKD repeat protein
VVHAYAADGNYSVTLVVKGASGTSITSQPVVLAASVPPVIGDIHAEEGDLVLSGSGGPAGGASSYYVLSSSDLAAPVASWTPVATNAFNVDGTFSVRLPVAQGEPQRFYLLQME